VPREGPPAVTGRGRAPIDDGAVGTPRPMPETTIGGRDAIAITPGAT
jgi:hypothetical protein